MATISIANERLPAPDALRVFRARHRLSQEAFAAMIGVRSPRISDYERGASRPDLRTATKIERATNGEIPATSWVDESALGSLANDRGNDLAHAPVDPQEPALEAERRLA